MMPMLRPLRLLALALGGSAAVAWAHTGESTGYASITVSGSTIRYSVTLPAGTLPSDLVEELRRAREGSQRSRETLLDVLPTRIGFVAAGIRCVHQTRPHVHLSWYTKRPHLTPPHERSAQPPWRFGIEKVNVEPTPTWLFTQIRPPCNSMNFRHKVSPRPVPSAFFSAVPTCRNSSNTAS
jgi:hypothetical protein